MRRIDRYILRAVLGPAGFSLALSLLVLVVGRAPRLIEMITNRGVAPGRVGILLVLLIPTLLEIALPVALLIGGLAGLGRLHADSEATAIAAAGIGPGRIARPVVALGALAACLAAGLSLSLRPAVASYTRGFLIDLARRNITAAIEPGTFSDAFKGAVLYVEEVEPPGQVLRGLLISGSFPGSKGGGALGGGNAKTTIIASTASAVPEESGEALLLHLSDGSLHAFDETAGEYERTDFKSLDLRLDLSSAWARKDEADVREWPTEVLRERAAAGDGDESARAAIEVERRIATPFAGLLFCLLALPLSVYVRHAVWARSILIATGVTAAYHVLLAVAEPLIAQGLPARLALWLPNAAGILGAAVLWRRASRL